MLVLYVFTERSLLSRHIHPVFFVNLWFPQSFRRVFRHKEQSPLSFHAVCLSKPKLQSTEPCRPVCTIWLPSAQTPVFPSRRSPAKVWVSKHGVGRSRQNFTNRDFSRTLGLSLPTYCTYLSITPVPTFPLYHTAYNWTRKVE